MLRKTCSGKLWLRGNPFQKRPLWGCVELRNLSRLLVGEAKSSIWIAAMLGSKFGLAALLLCLSVPADAQDVTPCRGDFVKHVKDDPYDFILTSRVEVHSDYRFVVTCIQNNQPGFFRLRWHIPGHTISFNKPDSNESRRPTNMQDVLTSSPGCFLYGNLNEVGSAFFHAKPDQLYDVELEKRNGCPIRFSQLSTESDVTGAVPSRQRNEIPKLIRYEQELMLAAGSDDDKELPRVKFSVYFGKEEKHAQVGLIYEVVGGVDLERLGLTVRPFGTADAVQALSKAFQQQIGTGHSLTRGTKLILRFQLSNKAKFSSAQLGIFNRESQLLASLWVPVLY